MTHDYITKIKANIGIYATKKSANVLDGSYVSVYRGRSMNFDDLREYVPGDSIRDIDWKASSRSSSLLVKRYVAEKKHNMLFVVDTSRRMLGEAPSGQIKKEIALYSLGTLGYLANKNGDTIGSVYMNNGHAQYEPFKTGLNNLEKILAFADSATEHSSMMSPDNVNGLLKGAVSMLKRRMIIFIITDLKGASLIEPSTLKRLKCVHDVLFVITEDAYVTNRKKNTFDMDGGRYIPAFIGENKTLARLEREKRQSMAESVEKKFKACGIASVSIAKEEQVVPSIVSLLERHKYVNNH